MKKLTVMIDMDGVIENMCEVWIEYLNEQYGTNVQPDDIKEWDMTKAFPSIDSQKIYEPLRDENLWKRVTPLPGAVETIRRIIEDGHKVVIVTASHQDTVSMKLNNVLFKYFPYLSMNDVIIASQKQLIRGDVLIDDAPHNLEGGRYIKLLFDAPHNRQYHADANNMTRVHNWDDIYKIICKMSEQIGGEENAG